MGGLIIIGYLISGAIAYWIIKIAVKNGVKEALQELGLLNKGAVRTIDAQNKDGDNYM